MAWSCPSRDRVDHVAHLGFEDSPRDSVEGHLCLVSGADALQRILLKSGGELLVVLMHEHHDGSNGAGTTYMPGRSAICVT